ncbi:unnamed protein product [Adineta ricciae]|uniref:t-SNARE coiled-coil homology domain-containing protein n=1 Tax=Adineta ricciae TaxID=249248 RepID=A0A814HTG3_ADIRI|nr:unnamed protein product [Adineta ricciae]
MTKDRLPALRAAQNAEDSDNDTAYVALNMEDNSRFMSDFFAHVDSLRTNIDKISELVDEVKRLHSTILAAPQADDRTKEELEEKMGDIKKLANDVRQRLKVLEDEQERATNRSPAQSRIESLQLYGMKRQFRDAMEVYSQVQLAYRHKCTERIQRQLEITGRSVTEGEVEEMLESGNPAVFTQGIMVETAQAKQSLADIEARHGDIIKLEKSIKELHDMFIDMAALVQTQGEMIDRIEFNVVQSENYVKAASTDTKKAVKFQSAARRVCLNEIASHQKNYPYCHPGDRCDYYCACACNLFCYEKIRRQSMIIHLSAKKFLIIGICVVLIVLVVMIVGIVLGTKKN